MDLITLVIVSMVTKIELLERGTTQGFYGHLRYAWVMLGKV